MTRDCKIIVGTMNASKSAQLLMRAYNLERQGKKVLCFKPSTDTRSKEISSRAIQETRTAIEISLDDEPLKIVEIIQKQNPDAVFVDELQFFSEEQVEIFARSFSAFDFDLYAYGLLIDYNGNLFLPIKKALECGFSMQTIDMQCDYCYHDATHHILYINGEMYTDNHGITVENTKDDKQEYKSVCFSCYRKELQN